jgi:hypothetical protein
MALKSTILDELPIFPHILKLFGLYPIISTSQNDFKLSKPALCFSIINIIITAIIRLSYIRVGARNVYADPILIVTDKISEFAFACQLFSLFWCIIVCRRKYAKSVAIIKMVDLNFMRLHYPTGVWRKKLLVFYAVAGVYNIIFHILILHRLAMFENSVGQVHSWLSVLLSVIISVYRVLGNLHFWLVLYAIKMRFDALRKVLKQMKMDSCRDSSVI